MAKDIVLKILKEMRAELGERFGRGYRLKN